MSSNTRSNVTTAVAATIAGAVSGGVFATITGRNLNTYMKFVDFLVVVALVVVGVWAYRTYVKPTDANEIEEDVTS